MNPERAGTKTRESAPRSVDLQDSIENVLAHKLGIPYADTWGTSAT